MSRSRTGSRTGAGRGGPLDAQTLRALTRRTDGPGLARAAGHVLALGATGWLVAAAGSGPAVALAVIAHGAVLSFLFAPLHETIHHTAFRSRWLNVALAHACGFLLLLPPRYFRAFHLAHHRHTQDPDLDPELEPPPTWTLRAHLWRLTGAPYWLERIRTTARHAAGRVDERFVRPAERPAVVTEARIFATLYAAVAVAAAAGGGSAVLWLWVVPALAGQPLLRLFLMAEHGGCPMVPDMLSNSRSIETAAPLRWLAWNMPYHAEHHAYAAIPFHALPEAHRLLRPRLRALSPGYLAVHRGLIGRMRG